MERTDGIDLVAVASRNAQGEGVNNYPDLGAMLAGEPDLDAVILCQPPENGAGLPDEQLIAIGQQVGAGDGFAPCVSDARYAAWTDSVTADATASGISSTPTVKVNGTEVGLTTEALVAAVQAS